MHSSARMGEPAATLPTTGIRSARALDSSATARLGAAGEGDGPGLALSFDDHTCLFQPFQMKVDGGGDFSPMAAPISRTEGDNRAPQ